MEIMIPFSDPQKNSSSYVRSIFEHPSDQYDSYQENGTKYLKSRKQINAQLQSQLEACAGEIFLSCIPITARAEKVADVAALMGEVYILRYKVNFSGGCRGFAFLQYVNPSLKQLAIKRLPALFSQHNLPMIRVNASRNSSVLRLKKIKTFMTTEMVKSTLASMIKYDKIVELKVHPGYFEYQLFFKCNEVAVHARRELIRSITTFGTHAQVIWDGFNNNEKYGLRFYKNKKDTGNMNMWPNKSNNIVQPYIQPMYTMPVALPSWNSAVMVSSSYANGYANGFPINKYV